MSAVSTVNPSTTVKLIYILSALQHSVNVTCSCWCTVDFRFFCPCPLNHGLRTFSISGIIMQWYVFLRDGLDIHIHFKWMTIVFPDSTDHYTAENNMSLWNEISFSNLHILICWSDSYIRCWWEDTFFSCAFAVFALTQCFGDYKIAALAMQGMHMSMLILCLYVHCGWEIREWYWVRELVW